MLTRRKWKGLKILSLLRLAGSLPTSHCHTNSRFPTRCFFFFATRFALIRFRPVLFFFMSSVFPITTERPFIKHYVAAMFAYFPNNNGWGIITTSSSGCLQFPLQMLFCCRGWIFVTLVSDNSWVQLAGKNAVRSPRDRSGQRFRSLFLYVLPDQKLRTFLKKPQKVTLSPLLRTQDSSRRECRSFSRIGALKDLKT